MKIEIAYVFPTIPGDHWTANAWRFIQSYHDFPPGCDHQTTIILNGPKPTEDVHGLFLTLPNLTFLQHDNSGWDLGGFQKAAQVSSADVIVFFASTTYFRMARWLERVAQVYSVYGNALYGAMGNMGDHRVNVAPHIRTTAFWCPPGLMNACPFRVTDPSQRYAFEHGPNCITSWVRSKAMNAWVVTRNDQRLDDWDNMVNGFHRGDQSNLLVGDHLTEPPYYCG